MNKQDLTGDKAVNISAVDISKVVGYEEVLYFDATLTKGVAITVHMTDGSYKTIEGADASESFVQALNHYLGGNLI